MQAEDGKRGRAVWPIAVAPGAFVLAGEAAVWIATETTGWRHPDAVGTSALALGLLAAIVAVLAIFATERPDALGWAIASVCVSVLGVAGGVALLFVASVEACGLGCLG